MRVLVIINTLDCGGAETFVMKLFREVVKSDIVFDFLINKQGDSYYKKEVKELGGKIYYGVPKTKNIIKSMYSISRLVSQKKYKKIFIITNHPMVVFDIMACRNGGAKIVLSRSTIATMEGRLSKVLQKLLCNLAYKLSDYCFAPSTEAAKWLYGSRNVAKITLLKNGVNLSKYIFSEEVRNRKRQELKIDKDQLLIGHVGRFSEQKNHIFLLKVFKEILVFEGKVKLILVGDGELKERINEYAKKMEISHKVSFLGIRKDVNELYMAMDVMIFPSLYEGLPNAVVEAQTTGLPCLISNTISPEVLLTDCVIQKELSDSYTEWAKEALELAKKIRKDKSSDMRKMGYDIKQSAKKIEKILIEN